MFNSLKKNVLPLILKVKSVKSFICNLGILSMCQIKVQESN